MRLTFLWVFQTLEGLVASQGNLEQFRRQVLVLVVGKDTPSMDNSSSWAMGLLAVYIMTLITNGLFLCERNGTTQIKYNGSLRYWASSGNYFYGNGAQIYGVESTRNYTNAGSDWWMNGGSIQADPPNLNFGLYVQHAIRSPTYVAFSDRRIKRDFLELDDSVALEKLRQLRPTSYRYKDRNRNTTDRVIGFVAQEVAEVLPDAVSTAPNIIPSIQIEASVTKIGGSPVRVYPPRASHGLCGGYANTQNTYGSPHGV